MAAALLRVNKIARLIAGICCSIGASLVAQSMPAGSTALSPADNIQSIVNSSPAGTTFMLLPGVYRMQTITPKNNDAFVGQGTVVLNGSQVLSPSPDPEGSGMWIATAVPARYESSIGKCQVDHPLCLMPQDLFIDNVLQTPASAIQGLHPGSWFFDVDHSRLYIPTNPTGHVVELGMKSFAFLGGAAGVKVSNLIVEKYATPAHYGAVGANKAGNGWVLNHVEARWNHALGIKTGPDSQIMNSFLHDNGQEGVDCGPANCRVIKNEISWNNYAGFATDDEGGGAKFGATTNLLVQSNYIHDNRGTGLWDDTNCVGTVFDRNTIVNNQRQGIQHEISYNAVISNNVVKDNGNTSTGGLWNAQILIQQSSNVEVFGNTVEIPARGGNGIVLMNGNRGSGILGPYITAKNRIHNNTITYLGASGYSGMEDSRKDNTAIRNSFYSNRYIFLIGNSNSAHWMWPWPTPMSWKAFQATGQEVHGKCCR